MGMVARVQVRLGVAPMETVALKRVAARLERGLEAELVRLEPSQPLQCVAQLVAEALDRRGGDGEHRSGRREGAPRMAVVAGGD